MKKYRNSSFLQLQIPELEQPVTKPALQTKIILLTSWLSSIPVSFFRIARARTVFFSAFLLLATATAGVFVSFWSLVSSSPELLFSMVLSKV